uniref:Uncharacterized protein n=1 Tax=Quercus lobata TaxID=97700 RepID=A0A7N2R4C7_QUELO
MESPDFSHDEMSQLSLKSMNLTACMGSTSHTRSDSFYFNLLLQVKVMKESPATFSALTYAPRRSVSKSQEQPVIAGPPPPPPVSETPVSSKNANENSSNKDYEVQMPSVLLMAALPNFPIS